MRSKVLKLVVTLLIAVFLGLAVGCGGGGGSDAASTSGSTTTGGGTLTGSGQ